uniref:Lipid scramblase CLPTM1L n=1 Tax=Heterorhabditis bacteriophora TaxID=37862 RepID=A0A1I7W7G9_HETBA
MGSWFNLTGLVTGAFLLFVSHSLYHFYQLFTPEFFDQHQKVFFLYYNSVNISLPPSTLRNGTLFVHCYLLPHDYSGENPYSANWNVQQSGQLTTYQVPSPETFRLISDKREPEKVRDKKNKFLPDKAQTPVAHLHSVLSLAASYEMPNFARGKKYLPLFYLDELSFRSKDLIQVFVNYYLIYAILLVAKIIFIFIIGKAIIFLILEHFLDCILITSYYYRDDIVFLIYLYQRYLYPVDHKRVNEYGEIGEEND